MAKVSASSSIGVKMKFFSEYENISPHASMSVEKEVSDSLSDDELIEEAERLHDKCRKAVENKINSDIESAKGPQKTLNSTSN